MHTKHVQPQAVLCLTRSETLLSTMLVRSQRKLSGLRSLAHTCGMAEQAQRTEHGPSDPTLSRSHNPS